MRMKRISATKHFLRCFFFRSVWSTHICCAVGPCLYILTAKRPVVIQVFPTLTIVKTVANKAAYLTTWLLNKSQEITSGQEICYDIVTVESC